MFRDTYSFYKGYLECQILRKVTRRNMMPMSPILEIEVFYCWGINFMRHFPQSFGNLYILLAVNYVSKWVEAIACKVNDHKVVLKFFREHIFSLWPSLVIMGSTFATDLSRSLWKSMEWYTGCSPLIIPKLVGKLNLPIGRLSKIWKRRLDLTIRIGIWD